MNPNTTSNSMMGVVEEDAKNTVYSKLVKCEPGDEILITGISGIYPKADNIRQFGEKLKCKEDLISDVSCQLEDGLSSASRYGKINEERIRKFDANFFKISTYGANTIDPQSRILTEVVYEAVMDAGYNPEHFRGTKTGVFIGLYRSDFSESWIYEKNSSEAGAAFYGNVRSMIANRVSFSMGLNGPINAVDSACSTSFTALDCAIKNIRTGICDAAIVAGCNLLLNWQTIKRWHAMGLVSAEGKCQMFSETADGYCRSEAIVALVLQKKKHAHRSYAEVVHIKMNNNGDKAGGLEKTSDVSQIELFQEFYSECKIDPAVINFVELHGTGTRVGDAMEASALDKIFCQKTRKNPLKVGSVKTNMGHSEAVSGLCSISKAILMFEQEMIFPNLHFYKPRSDITALIEGRIQVVTELEPFHDEYISITNLGIGGSNAHALFRGNAKHKINFGKPADDLPRLLVASSRTENGVQKIFDEFVGKPIDSEFVRLLHEIFADDIPNHNHRGYIVLNNDGVQLAKQNETFSGEKRPIWFIFRGMGSQYATMGETLLKIPITRESLHKSHEVLKQQGLNLLKIITEDDPNIFENILHSFVGIAAIQIALVDLLRAIGVHPDGIIGHSVGELGCAYADGCFTAEQMILAAFFRGKVSNECSLIPGYMAAVGLPLDELAALLPHDIDIACHNAANNYTVSGPKESIRKFSASLNKDGTFVQEVNVSNIAYHSRYIEPATPQLLSALKTIVPEPKRRSQKWICSSILEDEWHKKDAQYSSAEYFVNNLKNCVYFEEACQHIPNNAITVEISPHGFFQALLKRSSNHQITNIPLQSRYCSNGVEFLLSALGRLFSLGINMKIHELYPPVSFPVSRGTPMISPLIEWNHDTDYFVTKQFLEHKKSAEQTFTVSLCEAEWEFIEGHMIDGRILFPGVGYLYLVWKMFSKIEGIDYMRNSVVIENVKFKRATLLLKQEPVEFTINIQKGCGSFEITENNSVVASGSIRRLENFKITSEDLENMKADLADKTEMPLKTADIYKDYRLRGYQYGGKFFGIVGATFDGSTARIKWENNFITFLDSLLQILILSFGYQQLFVPVGIERITINTEIHNEFINLLDAENPEFVAHYDKTLSICRSAGVEIKQVLLNNLARKPLGKEVTLQKIEFLPFQTSEADLHEALSAVSEIIKRNIGCSPLKILELADSTEPSLTLLSPILDKILGCIPELEVELNVMIENDDHQLAVNLTNKPNIQIKKWRLPCEEHFTLIIASNLTTQIELRQFCQNSIIENGFLLFRESNRGIVDEGVSNQFDVCLDYSLVDERILLCRKKIDFDEDVKIIRIRNDSYEWIEQIRCVLGSILGQKDKRLILYSENDEFSGVLGLSNSLFKEYGTQNLRCYLIADKTAPSFSIHNSFYKAQISKDLHVNIYKQGSWGSFCDFLLDHKRKIEAQHAFLHLEVPGDISSLSLVEGPLDPLSFHSDEENILLYVYYSELNFRDVLLSSSKISSTIYSPKDCIQTIKLGYGCSGKTSDGKRYMAAAQENCFTTLLDPDSHLIIPVPDNWTLEEAATIPLVYLTVFYSFFQTERLHRGDSILIHSGTGGVGQAAIYICLYYGCTIFTTVGNQEKRDFIKKTFPSIPDSHIGCSRDLSFENMIMKETNGRGVDLVLNSLSEEKLLASVRCLAKGGRFIEIGLYDFTMNNPLYMGCFLKEISFHAVKLYNIFNASVSEKKRLVNMMIKHLNNGAIKPLNRTVFELEDAESAFRYMGSGKHIGKILLRTRPEESDIFAAPKPLSLPALPKFLCSDIKSYVICGGLGGLGLELIEWLVLRGARKVVISSRRGITTGYQVWKIHKWQSQGTQVIVLTDDVSKEEGIQILLQTANALGPVAAIFNLAMILKDSLFENQTKKSFSECIGPKSDATIHLDRLSRKICPHLEHFVVFSSVVCSFGNFGQTNYGMANSIIERICEKRKSENLPGLAIQWGSMADVGVVVENIEKRITLGGMTKQPVSSFLNEMDNFLKQPNSVVRSIILKKTQSSLKKETNVIDVIGKILGLKDIRKMDSKTKLTEYGMDSITTIEVKQVVEREFDIMTSIKDIKEMTIGRIMELGNFYTTDSNSTSKNGNNSTKRKHGYVQFIRDAFELLANQTQIDMTADEWEIVDETSITTNGDGHCVNVFVFPGFEGITEYMRNYTNHLNARIYCVKYGFNVTHNSLQQIAEKLARKITAKLTKINDFIIIAYSFGCSIAFEALKIIESQNRIGRLFLIDVDFILVCNTIANLEPMDRMMNNIVAEFISIFRLEFPKKLLEDAQASPDWNSKVELVVSQMPADVKFSKQQLTQFLNLLYQRMIHIRDWDLNTEQPLATLTTLIKPIENISEYNFHYDISKHFSSPTAVIRVEGNHYSMLKNVKIPDF